MIRQIRIRQTRQIPQMAAMAVAAAFLLLALGASSNAESRAARPAVAGQQSDVGTSPPSGSLAPNKRLSAEDRALIHRVDGHYNHLHSLRAAYTERYAGMGMERSEAGILLLKKPGRMRWNYADPIGKVFLLDGKYGWFYTPGDAQAQRIPASKLDDLRSPLRLLLGHTELERELDSIAVSPEGSGFRITGVPKGMAARVRLLTLDVAATGAITRIALDETDGATTEFRFSAMQEDLPLADSEFHFTPPPGITVVDGLPPI